MKLKLSFFSLIFILLFCSFSFISDAQNSNVLLVEITDTIDQSSVETLKESLQKADIEDSTAIILLLDTPGGGLQETFEIESLIRNSSIPIIGYVYPSGSIAASAGTFILMSSHLAAMADHTIIGSAQPVEIGLEGRKLVTDNKTINFLVAWIKERAIMYNRNVTAAEKFITENLDLNAVQAEQADVIEFAASSVDDLLNDINGTVVTTSAGNITLFTKDATQIKYSPSIKIHLLKVISNPVLTSLLLMLGIFALIFGISSPGFGAEVFGVIAILLSLIGSGFAISVISIIFIIVGCLLLLIEIFATPGFGVIGIGGAICLVIGGIFMVPSYTPPTVEWLIITAWIDQLILILVVAATLIAIFFVFLIYKVIQIRKKKAAVGTFTNEKAKTIDRITPDKTGYVRFKGELWQAKSNTTIEPNTKVVVIDKDETVLIVKPKERKTTKH
jgi:membrane-bound serine protease (ClpP class)